MKLCKKIINKSSVHQKQNQIKHNCQREKKKKKKKDVKKFDESKRNTTTLVKTKQIQQNKQNVMKMMKNSKAYMMTFMLTTIGDLL